MVSTGFKTDVEGHYIYKDPDARKDYRLDWKLWLNDGDTIAAVEWFVPPGLNQHNSSFNTTSACVEISGGTLNKAYVVTARMTTVDGLVDEQSFRIVIGSQ